MPTRVVSYKCNECNRGYSTFLAAVNCEDSHHKLYDFKISKIGKHGDNSFYPDFIHVKNQKADKIALYSLYHAEVEYPFPIEEEDA